MSPELHAVYSAAARQARIPLATYVRVVLEELAPLVEAATAANEKDSPQEKMFELNLGMQKLVTNLTKT